MLISHFNCCSFDWEDQNLGENFPFKGVDIEDPSSMLDLLLMIIFYEEKSGVQVIFHQMSHYLQWGQTSSNKILPSLPLRLPTIGNTECSTWFLECQAKFFVDKKKFATFAPAPLFLLSSTWLSSCCQPRWRRRRRTGDRQSCLSWWLGSPTWGWRWWRL